MLEASLLPLVIEVDHAQASGGYEQRDHLSEYVFKARPRPTRLVGGGNLEKVTSRKLNKSEYENTIDTTDYASYSSAKLQKRKRGRLGGKKAKRLPASFIASGHPLLHPCHGGPGPSSNTQLAEEFILEADLMPLIPGCKVWDGFQNLLLDRTACNHLGHSQIAVETVQSSNTGERFNIRERYCAIPEHILNFFADIAV
ncbi:hypothetical protein C8J57DRAFT_1240170 [Mycena rebaudengoi]|nr:hypothetical protein C8J57DRAFT_1240170 [Mycena rebaudengoi]